MHNEFSKYLKNNALNSVISRLTCFSSHQYDQIVLDIYTVGKGEEKEQNLLAYTYFIMFFFLYALRRVEQDLRYMLHAEAQVLCNL